MTHQGLPKPTLLLVLGVHRSGTSTVTRLLECLGALPSVKLVKPLPHNPKGFFEDADILGFHESDLLPALGMRWHSLAPPDWSRLDEPARTDLLEKAAAILKRNFTTENAYPSSRTLASASSCPSGGKRSGSPDTRPRPSAPYATPCRSPDPSRNATASPSPTGRHSTPLNG